MTVLLDTCGVVWAVTDLRQLSPPAVSLPETDDA